MANHTEPDIGPGGAGRGAVAAAPGGPGHGARKFEQGGELAAQVAGHAGPYPTFHGRAVSWVAVSIMMAGFLVGAFALVLGTHGPLWWLFWTGAGITALGLLIAFATNTFEDWC